MKVKSFVVDMKSYDIDMHKKLYFNNFASAYKTFIKYYENKTNVMRTKFIFNGKTIFKRKNYIC